MVATCVAVAGGSSKTYYIDSDPCYPREEGTPSFPFRAIQQGIKKAADGDTVRVREGTYKLWPGSTGIDFGEKKITLVSTDPNNPAATVIEGQPIRVVQGQGPETKIRGFTIRGAGIYLENSSPAIVQCVFEYCPGRAITCKSSEARIQNCIFIGNTIPGNDGAGGAIWCSGNAKIVDCTFTGNGAAKGGAIAVASGSPIIRNCILWGNASLGIGDSQIFVAPTATPSILYCDVQGGSAQGWFGTGNEDRDPLLTAGGLLRKGSPCIGKGTKVLPADVTATDIQGETRPADENDPNKPDMGADEWNDADEDGLPDFWEQKYFGGQTAADPVADSDGDALPNLQEYEASTDPKLVDTDDDCWDDGREVACGSNPRGKNLYVDRASGSDLYDGSAPDHKDGTDVGPKQTIKRAIEKAVSGQTIIIAPGIYSDANNCDLDFLAALTSGERVITIQSQNPFDPDIVATTIIDPDRKGRAFYIHDVYSPLSCVQGLTLRNGLANSSGDNGLCGGVILFDACSPTIAHCVITANEATQDGGALYGACDVWANNATPTPTILDCDIRGNSAGRNGGGLAGCSGPVISCRITDNIAGGGGAVANDHVSPPPMIDCIIANNRAVRGGGISNIWAGTQILTNCRLTGNSASDSGGALYAYASSGLEINGCVFSGNSAGYAGGGLYHEAGANPTLWNCTFAENLAYVGGGTCGAPTLINCILFENSDRSGKDQSSQVFGGAVINYCCIQNWTGSLGGVGNFGDDPQFADPGHWDSKGTPDDRSNDVWVDGDYHLKSQGGRWDPNGIWVQDSMTSPCIDAGDPNSPVGNEPEPNGARINMGAYGSTPEASKSYP